MGANRSSSFFQAAHEEQCDGAAPLLTLSGEQVARFAGELGLSLRETEIRVLQEGIVPRRYMRNFKGFDHQNQIALLSSRVALIGLGGLGGNILEILARMGVGRIRAADGDHFEECNANRQLLCTATTLGRGKAASAWERAGLINPAVELESLPFMLDRTGLISALEGVDLVVDALGGIAVKKLLLQCAKERNIPVITAAVAGWTCFVTTVLPGDPDPYEFMDGGGAELQLGCLAPAITGAAAAQCAEAVRILTGGNPALRGRLLAMDFLEMSFERLDL